MPTMTSRRSARFRTTLPNGCCFSVRIDMEHPIVRAFLSEHGDNLGVLKQACAESFYRSGLTYENLDSMNQNASWCIVSRVPGEE